MSQNLESLNNIGSTLHQEVGLYLAMLNKTTQWLHTDENNYHNSQSYHIYTDQ